MGADVGPVEYMVVAFPGSRFRGEIVPELKKLVDGGIVRIIDLAFVKRDEDGTVRFLELESVDAEEAALFADLDGEVGGLLSEEDLALIAEEIPAGSSAALLVWENSWATAIAGAIRAAGGVLVAHERVPVHVVEQDLLAISAAGAVS
ncbi:hypothetical protein P3T37_005088 [Kitasatospora sp. MAA4]|uniref:DUF6325 family protein n=1 Tax=Kitasatospora sp. MAA4 TaxID=3035093 RepID=UPI002476B1A1|nr:DUF6325 family protein [Kitasatospora sp. MAA4]MDH6135671.1 hypothetical protein [Kitasatospora sp. MAA4]